MWGKIISKLGIKDYIESRVKSKALEKIGQNGMEPTESTTESGRIISPKRATRFLIGGSSLFSVTLLLLAPLVIIVPSFSAVHLLAGIDPGFNEQQSEEDSGPGGPILLIAGHSYKPYCTQVSNECREETNDEMPSGYFEPDETRSLVKLIKSELESLNVSVDIANQLMAPGDGKMNTSLYVEGTLDTDTFKSINWSKYKYVLEVHFNAGSGSNTGPLLVKNDSSYSTNADEGIIEAITKNLGTVQNPDSIQFNDDNYHNFNYFQGLNIPITYLETEYYDNKDAMDKYTSKKSQIAKDIALVIRDTYGKSMGTTSYLEWAVNIANDDSHGYDWGNRNGPDYDCSSLVWHSLVEGAGMDPSSLGGSAFSTHFMSSVLQGAGFTEYPFNSMDELQPGDILLMAEHTEIYVGDGQNVGAHINEFNGVYGGQPGDQTGNEISISPFSGGWSTYYRLES